MMKMPELFLICGQNGAGKSTFSKKACLRNSMEVIDTDEIAKIKNITNFKVGKLVGKMIRKNLSEQKTFAYESTLTANFDFRIVEMARQNDYKINFVYIGLDSENRSRKRVDERVKNGGHDIPSEDISRRYQKSLDNLRRIIPQVDNAKIYCNSHGDYKKIARFSQGKIMNISDNPPTWFQNIYLDATKIYKKHRADLINKNWHNENLAQQDMLIGMRMRATGHSKNDIQMAIILESPVRSSKHANKCVEQIFNENGDKILQSERIQNLLSDWEKIETQNEQSISKEQTEQSFQQLKM